MSWQGQASTGALGRIAKYGYGLCPKCGKNVSLTSKGTIGKHGSYDPNSKSLWQKSKPCAGIGSEPAPQEAVNLKDLLS